MTERQYERRNIILELIGKRMGVGETNCDKEVLKNLDFVDEVITCILKDLKCNTEYAGFEGSMLEIKEKSQKILNSVIEIANFE